MTRDEIIRMARECGAEFRADTIIVNGKDADDFMVAFAASAYAAGQAYERKRILAICNEVSAEWFNYSGGAEECIRRIEGVNS